MTLHSLMMSQANFFLQFKSVVNKSAELKIVTYPKSNFRLTWAPKVGLGPPNWGVWEAAATSLTTVLLPLFALRNTMSSYCFNSSIARFSAFDRFGLGGLALFRISTTLDRAESIKHLLAKLTWLRPNSTPQ